MNKIINARRPTKAELERQHEETHRIIAEAAARAGQQSLDQLKERIARQEMYELHQKVFEACQKVTPKRFTLKLEDLTDVPGNEDTYEIEVWEEDKKTNLHILCNSHGYSISHTDPNGELHSRIVNKINWERVIAHYMLMMKEHL